MPNVIIIYRGEAGSDDLDDAIEVYADRHGGTFEGSGWFIPLEQRDLEYSFTNRPSAKAFGRDLIAMMEKAKCVGMLDIREDNVQVATMQGPFLMGGPNVGGNQR